jgi:tetratricopeptide (TPR) repeat protein
MLNAHLGAAHDISWGNWRDKEVAVKAWLDKAVAIADDLVRNEGGSQEYRFRVASHALAVCAGMRGKIDPAPWTDAALDSGKSMVAAASDAVHKAHLQWDLGLALYDAMQACQYRGDAAAALRQGEMAADYLEKGMGPAPALENGLLLGRLDFRLGAIQAIRQHNHQVAVSWFEKAQPLLERAYARPSDDLGRYGEMLVSMGVSYWETGKRQKAVELSEHGVALMELACKQGKLARPTLNVPYGNLASMHRQMGAIDKAAYFEQMAAKNKAGNLR